MKISVPAKQTIVVLFFLAFLSTKANAQCPIGYTRDTLDWDFMEFLPNTGSYVSPTAYITLAQSQTQRMTFGTQKVTFTHNYSGANAAGTNTTNTAETGAYGQGADVQFKGNGTITFTFQAPVQNLKFSMFDIDRSQKVTITAVNGVVPVLITTLAKLSGTVLTIAGSGTASASATATNTSVANNSTNGTINVDITGPLTAVTLTVTATGTCSSGCSGSGGTEDGSFWLSDISACYTGSFTTNYYNISKPYTGQPSYVLAVRNDTVYYVNVANGAARFLFADYGNTYINSMAYDPYNHMVYYTYSLSGAGGTVNANDRTLRRYDYDMDTLGVVSADVRNLGIPVFDQGVESGGAAFYDGSLYLGVEGGNSVTDRKSMIWKIDFNSSFAAQSPATLAFAYQSNIHDWADFGINDGILYDFNGSSGNENFFHKSFITGGTLNYNNSPSTLIPRQTGVDWTGKLYNIGSPSSIAAGTIVPYNNNGTVNTAQQYNITANGGTPVGSWGDAAEAFKPKIDFGDAPATYDPVGVEPGMHEENDSIYLGTIKPGIEWTKKTSIDATGDGAEEDGVTGLQLINRGVSNFVVPVKVFNKTGRAATLYGWVDANGNGIFEPSEGTTLAVPSSGSVQSLNIAWMGINCPLPTYSTTFMRLRLATNDCGLSTSTPNGYADNGEIEDYRIEVTIVLPDQKIELKAKKLTANSAGINWDVNDENGINTYDLERSPDGVNWSTITERLSQGSVTSASYSYNDPSPAKPVSYYRIKAKKNSGAITYSDTKKLDFTKESSISVSPNPVQGIPKLSFETGYSGTGHIIIYDQVGRVMSDQTVTVLKGVNDFKLDKVQELNAGVYRVKLQTDNEILITTFVKMK